MHRNIFYLLVFWACFAGQNLAYADVPEDTASPAIYAYFNISDDNEDSSLSLDGFNEQLNEISIGNYTVLSLDDILAKEDKAEAFAPNTIAITFDEPNTDTYATAIPQLIESKIPFAIFISPGNANTDEWNTLKKLQKSNLVTIGLTSYSYVHQGSWTEAKQTEDMNRAKSIFREKLGQDPQYFAYPFGEYSPEFVNVVKKMGFKAAFGQNSGVVTLSQDRMKLPRFTMTDDYGDIERFRTTSSAMPLPVKDVQPDYSFVNSMPLIGFTIDSRIADADVKKISCFSSGDEQPKTTVLDNRRVEIRFSSPPETDRLRINCTIAVPGEFTDDDPRYRWLGFLLYFPVKAEPEQDFNPAQP